MITPPTVGQRSQLRVVIVKTYLNENGYAVSGKCKRTCNTLIPFLIFLFIVTFITACAQPSAIIVTLRWEQHSTSRVSYNQTIARIHIPDWNWGGKAERKAKLDCARKCSDVCLMNLREVSFPMSGREGMIVTFHVPELSLFKWVLFLEFSENSFGCLWFLKSLPWKIHLQELKAVPMSAARILAPEETASHLVKLLNCAHSEEYYLQPCG